MNRGWMKWGLWGAVVTTLASLAVPLSLTWHLPPAAWPLAAAPGGFLAGCGWWFFGFHQDHASSAQTTTN